MKLIWDASPLIHADRIERLDVLGDLARGPLDEPWSNDTTAAVVEELASHGGGSPPWLDVVHVDGLQEILALAHWVGRVSSATHSRGEATVLAWAECHSATAIIDDRDARRVGQAHGLDVHGLLWVAARAVAEERWSARSAGSFVDQLIHSGARYPCEIGGFEAWCYQEGLLPGP